MHMHSGDKILRMRGENHDGILSLNVLPNGENIGQLQKQVSTKLNNHAPDGEKHRWVTANQNSWVKNGLRFILQ